MQNHINFFFIEERHQETVNTQTRINIFQMRENAHLCFVEVAIKYS